MIKPSNPEIQAAISKLTEALCGLDPAHGISYSELSAVAGFDILQRRYALNRARALATKECKHLFVCQHGIGIRKLANGQEPVAVEHARRKLRKGAKRGRVQVSLVMERNDLGLLDRAMLAAQSATFTLIENAASPMPKAKPSDNNKLPESILRALAPPAK